MRTKAVYGTSAGLALAVLLAASWARTSASQLTNEVVRIDNDDLGRCQSQSGRSCRGPATYATRALTHIEGGKGTTSKAVKFQLRPDPLAK